MWLNCEVQGDSVLPISRAIKFLLEANCPKKHYSLGKTLIVDCVCVKCQAQFNTDKSVAMMMMID